MRAGDTRVAQGGLMRCCLESLRLFVVADEDRDVANGDTLPCQFHADPHEPVMFLDQNVWRWVGLP